MSRAKASKRQAVQAAEPLRLWAVEWLKAPATWVALPSRLIRAADEDAAWMLFAREVLNIEQRKPDRADYRLLCVVPPAPERDAAWGEGQFDVVEIGPGMRAALRVTKTGQVKLTITGGDLDITAGACTLGLGILEASKRAAQVRVRREERARRRAERSTRR